MDARQILNSNITVFKSKPPCKYKQKQKQSYEYKYMYENEQ